MRTLHEETRMPKVGDRRLRRGTEAFRYLLFVCSVHSVELAVFRRARRADQAIAHAIELDPDERLLDRACSNEPSGSRGTSTVATRIPGYSDCNKVFSSVAWRSSSISFLDKWPALLISSATTGVALLSLSP